MQISARNASVHTAFSTLLFWDIDINIYCGVYIYICTYICMYCTYLTKFSYRLSFS